MGQEVRDRGGSSASALLSQGALSLALSLLAAACGHPATRAECDEIITKSAEIELKAQNVLDPAEIEKRTADVRKARGDELLAKCVGRRITASALTCVRGASTAEQVDRCLD